jgi:hypothetical protein
MSLTNFIGQIGRMIGNTVEHISRVPLLPSLTSESTDDEVDIAGGHFGRRDLQRYDFQ